MLSAIIQGAAGTGRALFFIGLLVAAPELLQVPALAASNIDTAQPFYLGSGIGTSVNPVFQGGTLRMNVPNGTYPQNFTLDGSATNTIDQDGNGSTFSGIFSNANATVPGNVTIANSGTGGSITLAGIYSYTGTTTISPNATLVLPSVSGTTDLGRMVNNGTLDLTGDAYGTSFSSLGGDGSIVLNSLHLNTITNAHDTFAGTISGIGHLMIANGMETLSGANTYSGFMVIGSGSTLVLSGAGNIPNSLVTAYPGSTLDISGASGNRSVFSLTGNGSVILGNRTLELTRGGSYQGVISGSGGLATDAEMTLTAVNTYTGPTSINAGTLHLDMGGDISASSSVTVGSPGYSAQLDISATYSGATIASLSGNGSVELGGQTLTISNAAGTFSGNVHGNGGLTIAGGTETLSSSITYAGPTIIGAGATLALAGVANIGASSTVTTFGTFNVSALPSSASIQSLSGSGSVVLGNTTLVITNSAGAFSGNINGTGGLVVAGGTQTLSGTNTYKGGTVISHATLAINSDAALGVPSGALLFDSGTLLALDDISSTRPIATTNGGGVVNTNAFTVSLLGPLMFDGPLTQSGAGLLILDGSVVAGGELTISNGTFSANNTVDATDVTITATGVLRGTGTINAPTTVFGTLAPGNSPGTLTFTAPLTLAPGSTTQLDIDGTGTGTGAGNYSRILVTGAANAITLAGTLQPLLRGITGSASNSYTPPLGQAFAVIVADGGISGGYSGLTQPTGLAPGTRFDTLYGANTLTLVVTPSTYGNLTLAGLSESATEAAVGRALDAIRPAAGILPDPASATLFSPLYALPGAAIPGALDQLSPGIYADGLMAARDTWYQMADSVGTALAIRRGDALGLSTAPGPHGSTIWANGLGQLAHVSGSDAPAYSQSVGGAIAGIDIQVTPGVVLGAAVGGASVQTSTGAGATDSGNAVQFALYGSVHSGMLFLDAQADYLHVDQSVRRSLSTWGLAANGNTQINGGGAQLTAGTRLKWDRWQIEPTLGLTALGLASPSVSETTGGSLAARVSAQSIASVQSFAGVRFGTDLALTPTKPIHLYALVGWAHEFADTAASTNASLALTGAGPFSIASPSVGRDAARLGVGLDAILSPSVSLYASYVASISGTETANNLTGGLRVNW